MSKNQNKYTREINILVDNDIEAGRRSYIAGKNIFRLVVRLSRPINLAAMLCGADYTYQMISPSYVSKPGRDMAWYNTPSSRSSASI